MYASALVERKTQTKDKLTDGWTNSQVKIDGLQLILALPFQQQLSPPPPVQHSCVTGPVNSNSTQ
jgi:hypothetical protein